MTRRPERAFRSVGLALGEDGAPLVVKRFHHPKKVDALLDGRRARREFEALRELARLGLPVPEPLELRRAEHGWELRMRCIEDARELGEYLGGDSVPPGGWPRLCAALGELLARLHAAGWAHADLHPGNVLVDARGKPWLIDVQRARPAPRADPSSRLDDLALCEALGREHLGVRARLRFLRAWLGALPPELRPDSGRRELVAHLVPRGRKLRASLVRKGLGRWTRASSRVLELDGPSGRAWLRRDLEELVESRDPEEALTALERHADLLRLDGAPAALRPFWLGAARLHEHGIVAAAPALFFTNPRTGLAVFELPRRGASPAALETQLAERGLRLARFEDYLAPCPGGSCLLPPRAQDLRSS